MASLIPESSKTIESSLAPVAFTPRPDLSLSQHTPVHHVTSVLLNGNNFPVWSRSFRLFLGGKGKTRWILGHHPKPATSDPTYPQWDIDNYTFLGWLFNSMEDRIYHMFIYNDTVHSLWTTLSQMYAHAHHDSQIFELYREIARASQETLGLSVADYLGFLQSRWEKLTQYEFLSDFSIEAATIAFTIIDGDERHRLLRASSVTSSGSPPIADQMAFAASSGSGPRSSGVRPICSYCGNTGHIRERCSKLHPELQEQVSKRKGKGHYRTATVVDTSPGHVPELSHIQS
ncbi:transducin family protein [Actinidia rufa]|uniref:Transducin family protein n=1 Tax=Actinidia rufa TaxID=165716 RepID=A0A7J0ELQ6_9ERIC|nr:transducin family protein [Actinidia rufa]